MDEDYAEDIAAERDFYRNEDLAEARAQAAENAAEAGHLAEHCALGEEISRTVADATA